MRYIIYANNENGIIENSYSKIIMLAAKGDWTANVNRAIHFADLIGALTAIKRMPKSLRKLMKVTTME